MKALSLYEMSSQYQFLVNELYDYEKGEVNEKAIEKINSLTDSIEEKCINITKFFQSIELTQEAIKSEKDRLAKREKAFKNQVDRLKNYLLNNMDRCEISKVECPEFVISIQKNPVSLEIFDEKLVPSEYEKKKIELDNEKIKEDLKNGVVIPGARLVQRKSVRIR